MFGYKQIMLPDGRKGYLAMSVLYNPNHANYYNNMPTQKLGNVDVYTLQAMNKMQTISNPDYQLDTKSKRPALKIYNRPGDPNQYFIRSNAGSKYRQENRK